MRIARTTIRMIRGNLPGAFHGAHLDRIRRAEAPAAQCSVLDHDERSPAPTAKWPASARGVVIGPSNARDRVEGALALPQHRSSLRSLQLDPRFPTK